MRDESYAGADVFPITDLPAAPAGEFWGILVNSDALPCEGCGATLPYHTVKEPPHTAETARHYPIVLLATVAGHEGGLTYRPLDEAGLSRTPWTMIAAMPEEIYRAYTGRPLPQDWPVEAAADEGGTE